MEKETGIQGRNEPRMNHQLMLQYNRKYCFICRSQCDVMVDPAGDVYNIHLERRKISKDNTCLDRVEYDPNTLHSRLHSCLRSESE